MVSTPDNVVSTGACSLVITPGGLGLGGGGGGAATGVRAVTPNPYPYPYLYPYPYPYPYPKPPRRGGARTLPQSNPNRKTDPNPT